MTNSKAWATIGTGFIVVASVLGIVVVALLGMTDTLRASFAIDLTKWLALGSAGSVGLFAIGKGIRDLGELLSSGGIPTAPVSLPPTEQSGTTTTPPVIPGPPS